MTKMTKVELFQNCINFIKGDPVSVNAWVASEGKLEREEIRPEELIEGLNHEIELLQRKAATPRKPTKTQTENWGFRDAIVLFLEAVGTPQTVKDITANVEGLAELSNQRVTHLLTSLRKDGTVKRTVVKKVPFYELGFEEGYANTEKEEG